MFGRVICDSLANQLSLRPAFDGGKLFDQDREIGVQVNRSFYHLPYMLPAIGLADRVNIQLSLHRNPSFLHLSSGRSFLYIAPV